MPLVIFCGFALFGLYLTIEAYFVRVLYDDAYIYCYAPWRKAQKIAWYDIKTLKFSPISYYFICSTTYSGKIRLSFYRSGVQEFLQEAERHGIPCPVALRCRPCEFPKMVITHRR